MGRVFGCWSIASLTMRVRSFGPSVPSRAAGHLGHESVQEFVDLERPMAEAAGVERPDGCSEAHGPIGSGGDSWPLPVRSYMP